MSPARWRRSDAARKSASAGLSSTSSSFIDAETHQRPTPTGPLKQPAADTPPERRMAVNLRRDYVKSLRTGSQLACRQHCGSAHFGPKRRLPPDCRRSACPSVKALCEARHRRCRALRPTLVNDQPAGCCGPYRVPRRRSRRGGAPARAARHRRRDWREVTALTRGATTAAQLGPLPLARREPAANHRRRARRRGHDLRLSVRGDLAADAGGSRDWRPSSTSGGVWRHASLSADRPCGVAYQPPAAPGQNPAISAQTSGC